jgi:hypothetical protein
MRTLVKLLGMALALSGPSAVAAQAREAAIPDSTVTEAAKRTLKSDLRNFVVAQEAYFADHGTYARAFRAIAFRPTSGVTIVLLTASDTAHSEIGIDDRVPGLVCAMFVGRAPRPLDGGEEGEVVCRDP